MSAPAPAHIHDTPADRASGSTRRHGVRQGSGHAGKRTHVVVAFVALEEVRLEFQAVLFGQRAEGEGRRLFPKFAVGGIFHGAAIYLLLRRSDAKRWDRRPLMRARCDKPNGSSYLETGSGM